MNSGGGMLHTTDPFGADRCPTIIGTWPRELQEITEFHPLNSMGFFGALTQRRITIDMVLVDGQHDYEYALFDLQMGARACWHPKASSSWIIQSRAVRSMLLRLFSPLIRHGKRLAGRLISV